MNAGRSENAEQLDMPVEDGRIGMDIVSNDESYMFVADGSEFQGLHSGIFGAKSLTNGGTVAQEPQRSDTLSLATDMPRFDCPGEPDDSGSAERELSSANTAGVSTNRSEQRDNPHPLGSSQNPIRIIQQGNKYTSLQELSQEQLNQIMQVRH